MTLVASVESTTVANDKYWAEQCTSIPLNALFLVLKMGDVIDFFKPVNATTTYCDMLQAHDKHQWSPNGVDWSTPVYDAFDENGSSQSDWPKSNSGRKDDARQYLSIWGRDDSRPAKGGCCSNSYSDYNSGFGKEFALSYAVSLQPLPLNTGMTLVADVAGTTIANDTFWAVECQKIPDNTEFLVLDMGAVRDFFKPIDATTSYCDMLQAIDKHQWSPNGVDWFAVPFHSDRNNGHNGGSYALWPRDKGVEGDARKYLSFWGKDSATGGCCSTSSAVARTDGNY
eukprot:gene32641-biopygen1724